MRHDKVEKPVDIEEVGPIGKVARVFRGLYNRLVSSDRCKSCGVPSNGHLLCDECAEFNLTW